MTLASTRIARLLILPVLLLGAGAGCGSGSPDKPCALLAVCVGTQEEADRRNAELDPGCRIYGACISIFDAGSEHGRDGAGGGTSAERDAVNDHEAADRAGPDALDGKEED